MVWEGLDCWGVMVWVGVWFAVLELEYGGVSLRFIRRFHSILMFYM